jgi:hypothetical protein
MRRNLDYGRKFVPPVQYIPVLPKRCRYSSEMMNALTITSVKVISANWFSLFNKL